VNDQEWLAARFEPNRPHLMSVAIRMLGSVEEAEDAVQEAWLRLSRSGDDDIEDLRAWLTTVVARVCLDMLRVRKVRREESLSATSPSLHVLSDSLVDPELGVLIADSIGLALLVVLQTMAPAERVAFVLHDVFELPFDEIAPIVGRTVTATRKLASRARQRVKGARPPVEEAGDSGRRAIVEAFMVASSGGSFDALLALLDPTVVFRADAVAVKAGFPEEIRGAAAVAEAFTGRARGARLALIDGRPGLVWAPSGEAQGAFIFKIAGTRISGINLVGDAAHLSRLRIDLTSLSKGSE
jgi:RNA polymerase sigma-70 factor, ECF subfamily